VRSRYRLPDAYHRHHGHGVDFDWRARGIERVVSLKAWSPLREAVATLKVVVDSATVPLVSWPVARFVTVSA
jgi:hypothetical protein